MLSAPYDSAVQEIPVSDATALKAAASSGDVKTLIHLLERFGGLNQRTERAIQVALQLASSYGQYHAVCKLIEVLLYMQILIICTKYCVMILKNKIKTSVSP